MINKPIIVKTDIFTSFLMSCDDVVNYYNNKIKIIVIKNRKNDYKHRYPRKINNMFAKCIFPLN